MPSSILLPIISMSPTFSTKPLPTNTNDKGINQAAESARRTTTSSMTNLRAIFHMSIMTGELVGLYASLQIEALTNFIAWVVSP